MLKQIIGLLLVGVSLLVSASTPTFLPARLVVDLNTVPIAVDSAPTAACSGAGVAYFQANDGSGFTGLWKSDGSTTGTTLVKQLGASGGQTYIHCLGVSANGVAYFVGSDPAHGLQLWRSDGTADGTLALTSFTVLPFSTPTLLAFLPNGKALFEVAEQVNGDELWISDGTAAGTHVLVDLTPGVGGSYISSGALWGSDFYFGFAGNPWKTDGTSAGTVKIADIGTPAGSYTPYMFVAMTHGVVFAATTQGPGGEIWTTDGTTATRVSDPFPAGGSSSPIQFIQSLGGRAVFQVIEPVTFKNQLWVTDATHAGTTQLGGSSSLRVHTVVGTIAGHTVFTAETSTVPDELLTTDGTDSGTRVLNAVPIGSYFATPTNIVYTVANSAGNYETWTTTGTVAGTRNLGDFNPSSIYDNQIFAVGDTRASYILTVTGNTGTVFGSRATLRRIDGQTGVLSVVTQLDVAFPQSLTMLDGKLIFSNTAPSSGQEPWVSDGSASGTHLLRDIAPSVRNGDSTPFIFAQLNGFAIMGADDGVHGPSLWRTDGTAAGTQMLSTVYPDTLSGIRVPNGMLNGRLLFAGTDAAHGSELWITDGTPAGTTLVKDIASTGVSGTVDSSHPGECGGFATLGNESYFGARYVPFEGSLWRTDGTDAGTDYLGTYRWSRFYSSADVCVYAQLNGYIYFGAETPPDGNFGLWRTDANSATGTQIFDSAGRALILYNSPIVANGYLYFTASNGVSNGIYKTDGTSAAPTSILTLDATETGGGGPYGLVAAGKYLFFSACTASNVCSLFSVDPSSGQITTLSTVGGYIGAALTGFGDKVLYQNKTSATGVEPWVSDGTPQGTHLLLDIVPGAADSSPQSFVNYNGLMYFTVQRPVTNGYVNDFWRTDGTTAGTVRIDNVSPSPLPDGLVFPQSVLGQHLLFSGIDATHGWELWSLDNVQPVLSPDAGTTPSDVPLTIDVLANDVDADGAMDPASTQIVQQPMHGTATVVAGAIQYTAAAGYVGSDSLTYSAADQQHYAAAAPATVSLTVTAAVGNGDGSGGSGGGSGSGSGGSGSGGSGGSGSGGSGSGGSGGSGSSGSGGSGGTGTGGTDDGSGGAKGGGGGSVEPYLLLTLALALIARHRRKCTALIASTLVACGGGGGSTPTTPPPPASADLAISPTSVTLDPGMTRAFSATGGEAPYTYDLASGAGSVDASSGVYTAASMAGVATVRVSDHAGHTASAAVTVNGSLALTPSPATVAVGATLKLTPSGGTGPYTLALVSGDGSLDTTSNTYTAPAATGTATVSVADSLGAKATLVININSGLAAGATSFTLTASSGQTYPVPVSGGTSPLTYSMSSGTGTVDANGVYTAGTKVGYDVVQVTDAHGVTSSVQIRLVEALTNGPILSLLSDPSGIYAGGNFTTVHPHVTSHLAALDGTSGKLNLRCDLQLGFDANASTMLVVGNSLYVGGTFTHYQGHPAHALVKLDATTCALDTQFTQATGFDGVTPLSSFNYPLVPSVVSLATDGTSLFVGGDFASYRGQPAVGLAKIDLVTGNLDSTFTQSTGFNAAVGPIAASADAVYVYGGYQTYRGIAIPNAFPLKLSARTGDVDPVFNATRNANGGTILSIAVSGNSVYIGGNYPAGISKLDATTGAADASFQSNLGTIQSQTDVVLVSGNSLYAGGYWTSLGGVPAGHIAKLDATTGKPDATFNRANGTDTGVWSLSVSGNSVYVAGVAKYGDQDIPGSVAKLDATTGALDTSFGDGQTFAPATPAAVLASGNTLYLAGYMTNYGGIPAQNIAKFDPTTWVADSQFLAAGGANHGVTKIISSGSSLYVAGSFSTFGGANAPVLAKVDPITGIADSQFSTGSGFEGVLDQDPDYLNGIVRTIALSGNSLYVGGAFQYYRGQPLVALAKIDAVTGNLDTTFNQPVGFTATPGAAGGFNVAMVQALALSGNSLYVSGTYTAYRGSPTFLLSKLDATSGALDSNFVTWTGIQIIQPPQAVAFNVILPAGNSVYAGGETLPVPGGPNNTAVRGVGKFDAATGAPDMAFISAGGVGTNTSTTPVVLDMMLSGTSLYAGGAFNGNLTKIDAVSGARDATFTQNSGLDDWVYSITPMGNALRISGAFSTYRGVYGGYSLAVDPVSGDPVTP